MCRKLTIERYIGTQGQKAPPRRPTQSGRTGFTLTEVVVASALLIFAIVPILKGLTSVHVTSIIIERKTRSLTLAQAKLNEIKARSVYDYTLNFTEINKSIDGSYLCTVKDGAVSANLRIVAVAVGYDLNGDNVDTDRPEVVNI
jgi:Tfp pilus assembly protein PilV